MSNETLGSMTVVQCWDDGVTADIPLIEILRKHEAKATFNLNAGLHEAGRQPGWEYQGTQVARLGWDEMEGLYEEFTIANHSLTHPHLEQIPVEEAQQEIIRGRDQLQQFFQQEVKGFAYPFGTYNEAVMEILAEVGHVYARTVKNAAQCFPPEHPMAFHPTCHFLAGDFWERYEAARECGVFYFWGHSYQLINEDMWADFDDQIARISADPAAQWGEVAGLFE